MTSDSADAVEETPDTASTQPRRSRFDRLPSPVFLALLGVTALGGWLAWNRNDPGPFVLVLGAWLLSIVVHEWSHAALACRWGARNLQGSGLLSFNPFRFPDRFLSVILPSVYLILGGFGLTGPAHAPDDAVESRAKRSIAAAVGPVVNLVFAAIITTVVVIVLSGQITDSWFWSALILLAFVQATAGVIALLPIPGLDGFAVIAPYLPQRWAARGLSDGARTYAPIVVFALLWFPPVHTFLTDLAFRAFIELGLNPLLFGLGQEAFAFWSAL